MRGCGCFNIMGLWVLMVRSVGRGLCFFAVVGCYEFGF